MTKPGVQTTEFWVHNVLQICTLVTTCVGAVKPQVGAILATVLACVYMVARAVTKYGDATGNSAMAGRTPCLFLLLASSFWLLGGCTCAGGITAEGDRWFYCRDVITYQSQRENLDITKGTTTVHLARTGASSTPDDQLVEAAVRGAVTGVISGAAGGLGTKR